MISVVLNISFQDTYLVFIALQCLSVPVALLLTPPEKVERSDGSKVQPPKKVPFKQNFVDLWKSLKRREVCEPVRQFFGTVLTEIFIRSCSCSQSSLLHTLTPTLQLLRLFTFQ